MQRITIHCTTVDKIFAQRLVKPLYNGGKSSVNVWQDLRQHLIRLLANVLQYVCLRFGKPKNNVRLEDANVVNKLLSDGRCLVDVWPKTRVIGHRPQH